MKFIGRGTASHLTAHPYWSQIPGNLPLRGPWDCAATRPQTGLHSYSIDRRSLFCGNQLILPCFRNAISWRIISQMKPGLSLVSTAQDKDEKGSIPESLSRNVWGANLAFIHLSLRVYTMASETIPAIIISLNLPGHLQHQCMYHVVGARLWSCNPGTRSLPNLLSNAQCSKERIYITSDLVALQWRHRWLRVAFWRWRFGLSDIAGMIGGCCLRINKEYLSGNVRIKTKLRNRLYIRGPGGWVT